MVSLSRSGPSPSPSVVSPPYRPPELLRSVHVLDFWELLGNQSLVAQVLQLHQSSVSRIVAGVNHQFLQKPPASRREDPDPVRYLRLAYRAHRTGEGVVRLATDPLLQPLLEGLPCLQAVPPRFRPLRGWLELIREGVIDGALVLAPSLAALPADGQQRWQGVRRLQPGWLDLELALAPGGRREVLLPSLAAAPLLHRELRQRQWPLRPLGPRRTPADDWLQLAAGRGQALPVAPALLPPGWLEQNHRTLTPLSPPLRAPIWLLIGQEAMAGQTMQKGIDQLQQRLQQTPGRRAPP